MRFESSKMFLQIVFFYSSLLSFKLAESLKELDDVSKMFSCHILIIRNKRNLWNFDKKIYT